MVKHKEMELEEITTENPTEKLLDTYLNNLKKFKSLNKIKNTN